jgi:hypothetical protein
LIVIVPLFVTAFGLFSITAPAAVVPLDNVIEPALLITTSALPPLTAVAVDTELVVEVVILSVAWAWAAPITAKDPDAISTDSNENRIDREPIIGRVLNIISLSTCRQRSDGHHIVR